MATDFPHEDDEARDPIADAYLDHLKHQPNSWKLVNAVTTKPSVEPHYAAFPIPIPEPLIPYSLTLNDKRLLRSFKIDPD